MSDAHMLTLVAAAAAAEAIESFADTPVQIKWPNDLFIGDRKVGGILMEVAGEQDDVEWVIVGIGVNVNTEYSELPVPLRRTATSLKITTGEAADRSDLLAALLLSLDTHYSHASVHGFERAIKSFRSRDFLLQRTVSVQTRRGAVHGKASGIDEQGALLVESAPRQIRRFHSGDVTLRT
jgi:BirA family biotin operon repressor/biotin-[acetyl-CoA-carboxylase] ligase